MTNPDHWNSLASDLGAEVPEQPTGAEEQKPATPAPPHRATPAAKKPAPPKPSADWSQLADQLGVAVPQPPAVPPRSSSFSAPAFPSPQPSPAFEPLRQRTPSHQPLETPHARHARDEERPEIAHADVLSERFGGDEPIEAELVEAEIIEIEEGEEDAAAPGDEERAPRKRRRRRRGGRRSKRDRPSNEEPQPRAEDGDLAAEGPEPSDLEIDEGPAGDAAPAAHGESDAPEQERKGRPRRRRRRGSDRKRDKEREPAASGESASSQAFDHGEQETPSDDEPIEDDAEITIDASGDDDGSDSATDKNSHRAIPAWEEAIGYIVSVNMEARAKNPKSGSPRGRGRGRGGGRGGNPRGNNRRS